MSIGKDILDEATTGTKGSLASLMFPALEQFGKTVAKGVKKGLTHKPTKWREQFYERIPAYLIEFETTDKSDFDVKGEVNVIFDFLAGFNARGLNYRVEIRCNNAFKGSNNGEFEMNAHSAPKEVVDGIMDRLRDQGNV